MIVVPGRQRGGHQRVLRAHHGRLVHEEVARAAGRRRARRGGCRGPSSTVGAEREERVEVRVQPAAADHVAAGRRHQRGAEAGQQRPGDQERRRGCARRGRRRRRCVRTSSAWSATVLPSRHSTLTPRSASRSSIASRVADPRDVVQHDLLLRQQARGEQRQGGVLVAGGHDGAGQRHAAFDDELLHKGWERSEERTPVRPGSWARVTTMSFALSREEAWSLFCEWTESAVAAQARAGRRGRDARLRAALRRGRGAVGRHRPAARPRLRALPRPGDRATRASRCAELEARGYPPELVRAVASHADFLGVSRDSPMEKTLFAVDELSGFVMACAYVRPTGIHGLTPKSVKKKIKTPAFAAAVNRDELRAGAEQLGVDFDEHLAFVIAALEARGRRARARTARARMPDDALRIVVLDGDETGPGAARAGAPGARPRGDRAARSSSSTSTCRWSAGARRTTRSSARPRSRCARPASASRRRRSRPRARTTSAPPTASCARRSTARSSSAPAAASPAPSARCPACTTRSRWCGWRSATPTAPSSGARARRARSTRSRCAPSGSRATSAARSPSSASGPPSAAARASTAGRSGRSPPSTRACSRRRWTRRPSAIPTSPTSRC